MFRAKSRHHFPYFDTMQHGASKKYEGLQFLKTEGPAHL